MSIEDVIRAWKDPEFRASLSAADRDRLPQHPAELIELSEAGLSQAGGMSMCRGSYRPGGASNPLMRNATSSSR